MLRIFSTWTGVLVVAILAVAMLGVAVIQYAHGQTPTAVASTVGLALVALLLSRRIARRSRAVPKDPPAQP
jgi:membrane protein implicated in regulation of membrane protease activity